MRSHPAGIKGAPGFGKCKSVLREGCWRCVQEIVVRAANPCIWLRASAICRGLLRKPQLLYTALAALPWHTLAFANTRASLPLSGESGVYMGDSWGVSGAQNDANLWQLAWEDARNGRFCPRHSRTVGTTGGVLRLYTHHSRICGSPRTQRTVVVHVQQA